MRCIYAGLMLYERMDRNPITPHLEAARREADEVKAQLEKLTRHYEIVRTRLDAYETASRAFNDALPKEALQKMSKVPQRASRTRKQLPSGEWQKVFKNLHMFSDTDSFDYEEIFDAATRVGVAVKKPSLRTKMMNYVNDGYLERVSIGRFRLTQKGMEYFEIGASSSNENAPPNNVFDDLLGGAETALAAQ